MGLMPVHGLYLILFCCFFLVESCSAAEHGCEHAAVPEERQSRLPSLQRLEGAAGLAQQRNSRLRKEEKQQRQVAKEEQKRM